MPGAAGSHHGLGLAEGRADDTWATPKRSSTEGAARAMVAVQRPRGMLASGEAESLARAGGMYRYECLTGAALITAIRAEQ